jgi:hypothetical protein
LYQIDIRRDDLPQASRCFRGRQAIRIASFLLEQSVNAHLVKLLLVHAIMARLTVSRLPQNERMSYLSNWCLQCSCKISVKIEPDSRASMMLSPF